MAMVNSAFASNAVRSMSNAWDVICQGLIALRVVRSVQRVLRAVCRAAGQELYSGMDPHLTNDA